MFSFFNGEGQSEVFGKAPYKEIKLDEEFYENIEKHLKTDGKTFLDSLQFFKYKLIQSVLLEIVQITNILEHKTGKVVILGKNFEESLILLEMSSILATKEIFQIKTDYTENLKKLLTTTGINLKSLIATFEIADLASYSNDLLDSINYLLCATYIPNLFNSEEKAQINQEILKANKAKQKPQKAN
jgi:hypothetical protein